VIPVATYGAKLLASILSVYVPIGRKVNVKSPLPFVIFLVVAWVSCLVSVTVAPGITPPPLSVTLPYIVAEFSCDRTAPGVRINALVPSKKKATAHLRSRCGRNLPVIYSPFVLFWPSGQ